jgi:hypothetical protein
MDILITPNIYQIAVTMKWEPGNLLDETIYAIQREFKDCISRVRAQEILRTRATP